MKQARIALGVILLAAILAVLLSWPERRAHIPIDITNTRNIYDKIVPNENIHFPTPTNPRLRYQYIRYPLQTLNYYHLLNTNSHIPKSLLYVQR